MSVEPAGAGRRAVTIEFRADGTWTRYATGELTEAEPGFPPFSWPPDATPVEVADAYQRLADRGYAYGPIFRGLRALWRRAEELFAEIELPVDVGIPRVASRRAVAAPIPLLAPVTNATRPVAPVTGAHLLLIIAGRRHDRPGLFIVDAGMC
jgi:acyl transferase domain-containing protein